MSHMLVQHVGMPNEQRHHAQAATIHRLLHFSAPHHDALPKKVLPHLLYQASIHNMGHLEQAMSILMSQPLPPALLLLPLVIGFSRAVRRKIQLMFTWGSTYAHMKLLNTNSTQHLAASNVLTRGSPGQMDWHDSPLRARPHCLAHVPDLLV